MSATRNIRTVAARELYSYFASPIAYVFLVIFLGIAGLFTFQLGRLFESNEASLNESFFIWHPFLYMVFVPAVGMRLWSEERRSGSVELLLTMPTTIWQCVLGKFLAGAFFLGLSLVLTFPVVLTIAYLGNPDGAQVFCGYLGSYLLALGFLALGSLTSAMTRNQIVSFILTVVICLLLVFCGWPIITEVLLKIGSPNWLVNLVESLSVIGHFEGMRRGVLDSRDFLYFLSLIAFGLFGTAAVLKSK